jgi:hypothetical protein
LNQNVLLCEVFILSITLKIHKLLVVSYIHLFDEDAIDVKAKRVLVSVDLFLIHFLLDLLELRNDQHLVEQVSLEIVIEELLVYELRLHNEHALVVLEVEVIIDLEDPYLRSLVSMDIAAQHLDLLLLFFDIVVPIAACQLLRPTITARAKDLLVGWSPGELVGLVYTFIYLRILVLNWLCVVFWQGKLIYGNFVCCFGNWVVFWLLLSEL